MPDKRPFDHNGALENGSKRPRSENGSPAPTTKAPSAPDRRQLVEEAKARAAAITARLAASRAAAANASASPAMLSPMEIARARAAAMSKRAVPDQEPATVEIAKPSPGELARAKAEALHKRKAAELASQPSQNLAARRHDESMSQYRARVTGGLSVGLHPALQSQENPEANLEAPKPREKTKTSRRREPSPMIDQSPISDAPPKKNPYIADELDPDEIVVSSRPARPLVFAPHGKYIEEAAKQRRKAQLEDLRVNLTSRTGEEDDQLGPEKAYLIDQPPEVEWWDEGLINGTEYGDLDAPGKIKFDDGDSLITNYILHPVQIEPPQDKLAPPVKPMYLTKKETAKIRRQRRKADLKEEQAKIRLGLVEPPPPKVKKSNLMRVLGEQAVKDPTAVEARVNQEIAGRLAKHEAANAERALTKEERTAKSIKRQEYDLAKGVHIAVYRIDNLSYGKHRYQIDMNAKQRMLTGICVMNPEMNVLVVEGGARALYLFRKLLQRRIKWDQNVFRKREEADAEEEDEFETTETVEPENKHPFLSQFDENGNLRDLSQNKCLLVWEGEAKQRSFKQWRGMKACDTEQQAKDQLGRVKMENMWNLAKSFDTSEVQTLWLHDPTKNPEEREDDGLGDGPEDY